MKLTTARLKRLIREELSKVNEEMYFSEKAQDAWYQSILDTMQPKHKAFAKQNYALFKDAVDFFSARSSGGIGQMPQGGNEMQRELENSFDYPAGKIRLLGQMVRILLMSPHETSVAMRDESKEQFMQDSDKGPIRYGDAEPEV